MIELLLLVLSLVMGLMPSPTPVPTPTTTPVLMATATPVPWALMRYFPAAEWQTAWAVEGCESKHCTDPRTYDLSAPDGGCMQINRATWEGYFLREHGWTWEQIVFDDAINYQAAAVVWERWGRTWGPWRACL